MSASFKDYLNSYEFNAKLLGVDETVSYTPITTSQLKKLLVHENEQDREILENAFDKVMNESITSDHDVKNMYLQDRFYLLVEMRKNSKGKLYQFSFKCPKCENFVYHSVDLGELPYTCRNDKADPWVNLTENISIMLDFITRNDQIEAYNKLKEVQYQSQGQKDADYATYTLANSIKGITSPAGEEYEISLEDKVYLLDNVSAGGYDEIKSWYDDNNFGLDFTFSLNCMHCSFSQKQNIPLHDFFT